jgi:hypothetical protein
MVISDRARLPPKSSKNSAILDGFAEAEMIDQKPSLRGTQSCIPHPNNKIASTMFICGDERSVVAHFGLIPDIVLYEQLW